MLSAGTSTKAATINGALFSVADVPLSDGENTLTVVARDPAGNKGSATVSVTLDISPLGAVDDSTLMINYLSAYRPNHRHNCRYSQ